MVTEQEPETLIKFLGTIPSFIWPVICVVIGGVLTWIPLRWQLKHDSKEKERERQMSLRRDVYLFAADERLGDSSSGCTPNCLFGFSLCSCSQEQIVVFCRSY